MGGNKHTLGLNEEAHIFHLKALELFEQYVKPDLSAEKDDSYYRDKVNIS